MFLSVGFFQIVPKRLDCSCLCRCENYSISRGVSPRIMYHTCLCHMVTMGLQFISILMLFKIQELLLKTAKGFAHITVCKFLIGFSGLFQIRKKLSSSPCFHLLSLFCDLGVVSLCGVGKEHRTTKTTAFSLCSDTVHGESFKYRQKFSSPF